MIKFFLTALATVTLSEAQSIQQLIDYSLKKHPSLATIQHRLSVMDDRIVKSKHWSNPEIILNISDIQFDEPGKRSIEPMQYQAVNVKQRFPWFGKTEARERFVRAQKIVMLDSYDMAKTKLAEKIRTTCYTILEIKERLRIIGQYERVTRQNIALYDAYTATDAKSHSDSMVAQLMLSTLHIRSERYKAALQSQEATLAYLVQMKEPMVSDTLHISAPKSLHYYLSRLENSPGYRKKRSQSSVADAGQRVQELAKNPDIFMQVGYYNRQRYKDYASIAIGVALPLFGTEKLESEAARKEALAVKSALFDYRARLESEIRMSYAGMKEAYRIYRIIRKESLPKLQHMLELNEASIQSGENLFTYIKLLEQRLDLEEEKVIAKAQYLRSVAKLKSLIGEIK